MDIATIQGRSIDIGPVQTPNPTPKELADRRELVQAVKQVNQAELLGSGRELTYSIDRQTHKVITKLVDASTGEVVDQIPAEYVLRLAEEYKQSTQSA